MEHGGCAVPSSGTFPCGRLKDAEGRWKIVPSGLGRGKKRQNKDEKTRRKMKDKEGRWKTEEGRKGKHRKEEKDEKTR